MKKKAVILSMEKIVCDYIKSQMDKLVGDLVDFSAYSLEEGVPGKIACDACIFPTEDRMSLNLIADKLLPGAKFLSVRRTLLNGQWHKLGALPYGTNALLVNTSKKLSLEAISFLLELGANHIHFEPYYPGAGEYPQNIKIAVTPDELECVPKSIGTIVNIGPRVIDSSTMYEMLILLNILNQDTKSRLLQYTAQVMPNSFGLNNFINQLAPENEYLKEMVHVTKNIVLACDEDGKIIYSSQSNRQVAPKIIYGKTIVECLGNPVLAKPGEMHNEIIDIDGIRYLVNRTQMRNDDHSCCSLYHLSNYNEIETAVYTFRQKKLSANKAKYTFQDIIGSSDAITKAKQLAMKAAQTELDILIEAETGTGKELLANSIHNASRRKDGPFVAFNCAAISSNLLESELFGYEDGAFTGAKKGGKIGLIEASSGGTLFLDEVGEISLNTQVKLLRVLQEREVIRVGGTERIPVNIRVIAATNRDLDQLVSEDVFRKDLYYRLNVLPIRIPPLRERREDVIMLLSSVLNDRNVTFDIPDEVMEALKNYEWPGNVRELINCCEYIVSMESCFTLEALPDYMKEKILANQNVCFDAPRAQSEAHAFAPDTQKALLELIDEMNRKGLGAGRKSLSLGMIGRGLTLGEGAVRALLEQLQNDGLIACQKGRGGTRLTRLGKAMLAH